MKPIAPHFWKELEKVRPDLIGKPFTVNDDGSVLENGQVLTNEEKSVVFSVWQTHNPNKYQIYEQIYEKEAEITMRRLREAILGVDNGWLAAKEEEIKELRKQL